MLYDTIRKTPLENREEQKHNQGTQEISIEKARRNPSKTTRT